MSYKINRIILEAPKGSLGWQNGLKSVQIYHKSNDDQHIGTYYNLLYLDIDIHVNEQVINRVSIDE